MRLFGDHDGCGPLLELGQMRRLVRAGAPITEGEATIAVNQIIGSVNRARDFDASFHPRTARMRKRLADIIAANPSSLDEPIDVIRVDRAYFVSDGHKRVAIARQTGREFLDARVSRLPSPYAVTPELDEEEIERTAREGEFRRHSGIGDAVPEARFPLTDVSGYGELLTAVQSFAFDRIDATGQAISRVEAAGLWYREKYLPMVATARKAVGDLLDACSDGDLFLAILRHERASWGSECDDAECIPDMLVAEQQRTALAARSPIDRVLGRDGRRRRPPAQVLPLADPANDIG
jgi:hypothetical protein